MTCSFSAAVRKLRTLLPKRENSRTGNAMLCFPTARKDEYISTSQQHSARSRHATNLPCHPHCSPSFPRHSRPRAACGKTTAPLLAQDQKTREVARPGTSSGPSRGRTCRAACFLERVHGRWAGGRSGARWVQTGALFEPGFPNCSHFIRVFQCGEVSAIAPDRASLLYRQRQGQRWYIDT